MSDYRDPGLNQIIMSGRLARDSELKYTQDGKPILKNALAVSEGFGDKKHTEFYDLVWFGSNAEKLADTLSKGRAVIVSGRLGMNRWEGREGETKEKPVIICNMIMQNDWKPKQNDAGAPKHAPEARHDNVSSETDDIPF